MMPSYLKRIMFRYLYIFCLCTAAHVIGASPDYKTDIQPLFQKYCYDCHGANKQKGKVRLDNLPTDLLKDNRATETWHDALDVLNKGEMPPEDERQPTAAERATLTHWLQQQFDAMIAAKRSTAGRGVIRRLNREEYQNTMRDLLGIDMNYVAKLPPESLSPDGFRNNGASLGMSGLQLEYMLESARNALKQVIMTGEAPEKYRFQTKESSNDKNKGYFTNRLGRVGTFVGKITDFPDEGPFIIRVKARAELPSPGAVWPRMQLRFGYRADTQTPSEILGAVDIDSEESKIYEFRGRMEAFPLQTRTQSKYPGQLVWITNVYDNGKPAPKQQFKTVEVEVDAPGKKGTRKQKKKVVVPDPEYAHIIVESFEFDGPIFDQWPPKPHRDILFDSPLRSQNEDRYVYEVLDRFMSRAYRRPVKESEVSLMHQFYQKVYRQHGKLEDAIRDTLAMVLISPDFLFLVEPGGKSKRLLTDYERASRLSYFLWSSMPDQELFNLAAKGALQQPETLKKEVRRMLADPGANAFIEQFSTQWFDLDGVDRVAINPNYYPDFDLSLKSDMRNETIAFFGEVLKKNLSARCFIDADFAMLNEPLARHYGLSGPRTRNFERVALQPGSHRGGVVSQGSILLSNSTGEDSHPIKRAVWILERLLHDPPSPPPPDVPALDSDNADISQLPILEQLEAHRENESCANCHKGIDPWGITLEQFDAVGRIRTEIKQQTAGKKKYVTHPVIATANLPGGHSVEGLNGLKDYLLQHKELPFAHALANKLLSYATGRSMEIVDEPAIKNLATEALEHDLRLREFIEAVVVSEPFLTK